MFKTTDEWKVIIGNLPQPDGESHYETIANRALSELHGYRRGNLTVNDVITLGRIMEALVQLELAAVTTEAGR